MIEQTGVLTIKLDWLNNNYKRYFSRYVTHADANKLRELTPLHRYASLVCFLQEAYRDTIDHIFDMYQKAIGTMYNQADKTVDTYNKSKRANTRSCLTNHKKICGELLAIAEGTAEIEALLKKISRCIPSSANRRSGGSPYK
jgi:poly-beta-hydroxyalkanoate depolymerase